MRRILLTAVMLCLAGCGLGWAAKGQSEFTLIGTQTELQTDAGPLRMWSGELAYGYYVTDTIVASISAIAQWTPADDWYGIGPELRLELPQLDLNLLGLQIADAEGPVFLSCGVHWIASDMLESRGLVVSPGVGLIRPLGPALDIVTTYKYRIPFAGAEDPLDPTSVFMIGARARF